MQRKNSIFNLHYPFSYRFNDFELICPGFLAIDRVIRRQFMMINLSILFLLNTTNAYEFSMPNDEEPYEFCMLCENNWTQQDSITHFDN